MKTKTTDFRSFYCPTRLWAALMVIGVSLISAIESHAQYTYKHSPIGGGGFVTGIVTHKTTGERYCRTDVGGAYRWDATNNKWVQLLDWLSDSQVDLYGVEALALDPQNANNIYMLCGTNYGNGKSAILKSTDKGNTFTYTMLTDSFKVHGNGDGRGNGERLAVDPHNSNILFCGTRANGLWKSTDAGVTWNRSWSGVTTTANGNGICLILFDPASSVVNGVTQTFYIGVSRTGGGTFYKTTNGGASFTDISPTTSFMPHRAALQGTTMYVTFADGAGPATNGHGQVWKQNTSTGTWTDVTPNGTNATPAAWSNFSYGGVSIDPANVNRVVISTSGMYQNQSFVAGGWGDFVFISTNGGTNWTLKNGLNATWDNNGMGWVTAGGINWMDCIEFDKSNPNIVRHIGGGGVFTCSDITATNPSWKYDVIGIEETALLDGISIPGGPFISSFGDVTGFVHEPLTSYPTKLSPGGGGNNNSIAYAAANPNKVVRVGNGDNIVYYSNDKGTTWTGAATNVGSAGRVSISADGGTILHCPSWSLTTSYSTNNGASWASCSGVSVEDGAAPVADQVNSNIFYIYSPKNGQFFRSTNKGVSFSEVTAAGASTANHPWEAVLPRTVPGREGHVWIPIGRNGLKYTTNGGSSYTTVANVSYCKSIGIGKTMAGMSYPTVFIWGTVSGVTGLFRSTDQGASWLKINDDAHQFAGAPLLVGDMNVEGRVYMSAGGGRGLIYWEPAGACTPTAITPYMQVGGTWSQTSSATVASGATVILGPQPASGGSWSWSGMASGTSREVTLTPTSSGTATATYTNASGCQSTQVFTITVSCTPTAITPYMQVGGTWSQTSSATVTSGATVILGPQPTSGGSWSWSGLASGTSREVTLTPTSSGTATATYTNTSGCQSTQNFTITVNGGSTYVTIANRATGLLIDGMGRTTAGSACGQYASSGSYNQMWTLETSGSYVYIKNRNTGLYIDGRGTSTNGEYAGQWTSAVSNNLEWQQETAGSYVKFKNRATGLYLDGMGKTSNGSDLGQWSSSSSNNQQWSIASVSQLKKGLSIDNPVETGTPIVIYPNPFSTTFNLTIDDTQKVTHIEIFDMTGKLVETIEHSSVKNYMELGSSLKPNVYVVKVYGESYTKSFKVIKE